jgi:hypothetical protein
MKGPTVNGNKSALEIASSHGKQSQKLTSVGESVSCYWLPSFRADSSPNLDLRRFGDESELSWS